MGFFGGFTVTFMRDELLWFLFLHFIHYLPYWYVFPFLSKVYGRYNDLLQHYNTPLSQFLCDLVLCCFVLHTLDLASPDMTDYPLDSTADAGELYSS